MAKRVKVGIIGTGAIFGAYVRGCRGFTILEVAACANINRRTAEAKAAEFEIPRVCSVKELLADPEIEMVINLTVPTVHAEVSLAAIEAGKHVHSEKPLAVTREDACKVLASAQEKGVLVSCAPDTFLGGSHQTCRKLIDDGWIGEPVAAVASMVGHGPEAWHPKPDFFYQVGGGPLLDVGPYLITALVHLFGPVRRVSGATRISFPERIATSQEHYGRRIPVQVPTHVTGALDFAQGPVATIVTSFDVWSSNVPHLEVYGSEGTLSAPTPNDFGGPVRVRRAGDDTAHKVPITHNADVGRGIGAADLAYAVRYGRPPRASGELAYHVLDVLHAIDESSQGGWHVEIESRCVRPAPLPPGLLPGELDGR